MIYEPIGPVEHPTLTDTPLYINSEPFSQVPQLGFLKRKYESISASSLYYDPLNPSLSLKGGVSYIRSRYFTTLHEIPLKFRHKGTLVDMEVLVDTYTYIAKTPDFGEFSPGYREFVMREGDRYERLTSGYVYQNIEVPERSGKIWDGRHDLCVDAAGNAISSESRLEECRNAVKSKLEDPELLPYTVLSLGGYAHTTQEPDLDGNTSRYNTVLRNFLVENYNADEIPSVGELDALNVFIPLNGGAPSRFNNQPPGGRFGSQLNSRAIAAELDGYYFKRWVSFSRYGPVEIAPAPTEST
jgi:hypothetical protein